MTAKGIEASGSNNTEAGVAYLEEAGKLDPKNDLAFAKLGEIFVGGSQTERGISNYEKALAANLGFTELYVPLGLAYLKVGNIAKAQEYSAKADAAGAATADATYLRAMVLYKQNKNDEALAAFQKTLTIDPNYSSAYSGRCWAYNLKNDPDRAIADCNEAIRLDAKASGAFNNRGVAYVAKRDYTRAIADYDEALKLNPKNAVAFANRGILWGNRRDYDEVDQVALSARLPAWRAAGQARRSPVKSRQYEQKRRASR